MDQLNLNMMQCRSIDVVNDNDYQILYHLEKANAMVDLLSHKITSAPIRGLGLWLILVTQLLKLLEGA